MSNWPPTELQTQIHDAWVDWLNEYPELFEFSTGAEYLKYKHQFAFISGIRAVFKNPELYKAAHEAHKKGTKDPQ